MARSGLMPRLLVMLAVAVLPALGSLYLVRAGLSHERVLRAQGAVVGRAQSLALTVGAVIDSAGQLALTTARLEGGTGLAGCTAQLVGVQDSLPGYAALEVVDAGGAVLCGAGPRIAAADVAGALRSGAAAVGHFTLISGARGMLPVVLPAALGRGSAAVVVGIDLDALKRRLALGGLPRARSITLADAAGTVLVAVPPGPDRVGAPLMPNLQGLVRGSAAGERRLVGADGVARIIGYMPAAQTEGVFVAAGISVPAALAGIDRVTQRAMLLVAACGLVALLLLIACARRFVYAPAASLLATFQRWSQGDRAARAVLHVSEASEFGRLATAFNTLAETLEARQRQLEQLNHSLEARVADRTAILSKTNNRLLVEIAERERTDAALRRAQKLQAVGQLAGGVAHEFNNLLTIVLGALDLVRLRLPQEHPLQRNVGAAMTAAQRGARLTSQLLVFARRRRLLPISLDLNAVVSEMRELLEGTVGRSVSLRLDLGSGLWPALADPNEIEAAILNLALNARDAMGQGGVLTLTTRNTVLPRPGSQAEKSGAFVELMVEDDGAGMSEDDLAHAIDPFFTTKAPGQGAGLGLSQVHGIVQQLGGELTIASAEGVGTTVSVFLPRAVEMACAPDPRGLVACRRERSILLVDDDDQVRQIAAEMLTELGYEVVSASNGPAALEALRGRVERPFSMLVVDYAMPGMSGLEVIEQAHSVQPDLVALVITGYMELGGTGAAQVLPAQQVLRKPFTLRELADRIAELTSTRAPESLLAPVASD